MTVVSLYSTSAHSIVLFIEMFVVKSEFMVDTANQTFLFIRPSSDGTYYGMVMSVRSSQFSSIFSYMLRDIELKFCVSLYFDARKLSLNAINFRQFFLELCPFLTLNSYKYLVFRTFLLHALIYWVEMLHMTLFYYTMDQVRVSSICVNFCRSYAPFGM